MVGLGATGCLAGGAGPFKHAISARESADVVGTTVSGLPSASAESVPSVRGMARARGGISPNSQIPTGHRAASFYDRSEPNQLVRTVSDSRGYLSAGKLLPLKSRINDGKNTAADTKKASRTMATAA